MRILSLALLAFVQIGALAAQDTPVQKQTLVEELRIGSIDDPETSFGRVVTATTGPDGTLYVLESDRVVLFSSEGRFLRAVGREGQGPGEFQNARALGWLGDTLWIADPGQRRFTLFSWEGELLATRPVTVPSFGDFFHSGGADALLDNGSALAKARANAHFFTEGLISETPLVQAWDSGDRFEILAVLQESRAYGRIVGPYGAEIIIPQILGDASMWSVAPSGGLIVVVDRPADAQKFVLSAMDANGDTLWTRAVSAPGVPVSNQTLETFVEILNRRLGAGFLADMTEARREELILDALFVPKYLPPVNGVLVSDGGEVWLQREHPLGVSALPLWEVRSPAGDYLYWVETQPSDRLVHVAGDRVLGIRTDELGVQSLVRYRVVPD